MGGPEGEPASAGAGSADCSGGGGRGETAFAAADLRGAGVFLFFPSGLVIVFSNHYTISYEHQ